MDMVKAVEKGAGKNKYPAKSRFELSKTIKIYIESRASNGSVFFKSMIYCAYDS
jgi:hypothetical protein